MWRSERDESNFTDAELLAWEHVLPQKHICIIDSDWQKATELAKYFEKHFTKRHLKVVVARSKLRKEDI